ncbi:hypothetical protein JTT00_02135 [Clostridium botulinum]|nr:hypothetical protein [Clostridium botulinum]MCS4521540.1 hypothetical protein [Clostridium botulinum]
MIFEQLKYTIRSCDLPHMYYIGKIYEIFAIIIRNLENEKYLNIPRHNHLSYQNKQFMWTLKEEIDKNILNPPTIEEMKNIAEMSESKLRRCFKATYGKQFMNILDIKRWNKQLDFYPMMR